MKKGQLSLKKMAELFREAKKYEGKNTFTNAEGDQIVMAGDKMIYIDASKMRQK